MKSFNQYLSEAQASKAKKVLQAPDDIRAVHDRQASLAKMSKPELLKLFQSGSRLDTSHAKSEDKWSIISSLLSREFSKKTLEKHDTYFAESFASGVSSNYARDIAAKNRARMKADREAKAVADKEAKKAASAAARSSEREEEQKLINKFTNHEIPSALSATYPDTEPYDYLARKFPQLARETSKKGRGSRLNEIMNLAAKKEGYRDMQAWTDDFYKEQESS